MKKLFSVIISIVFLLSLFANLSFANEVENQISNIATQGIAYSSSEKNSLWTPAKTINDGVSEGTWEGWECAYPTVQKGQDTSFGFSNEYCGIDFSTKFFEISEVKISLGIHRLLGGQNMKYELKALVEGDWKTVVTFRDSDTTPHDTEKYPTYEDIIVDETAGHRTLAHYYIELDRPIASNNFRLCISEFGKNYEGGDVQVFPYIYEIELYGIEVNAPEIILPEGATATTNIAWYSYPQASSSMKNHYPFLAIDEDESTYWSPLENDNNPSYTLVFDKEYAINKISLKANKINKSNLSIKIMVDGAWIEIDAQPNDNLEYLFTPVKVTEVKLELLNGESIQLIALEAHLADLRTYYFDNRFESAQMSSASNGNIAIIGKPYASSSFTPYSDVNYINDGLKNDRQWFTGTVDVPEHCGLTFDFPQKISKAQITVKSMYVYGIEAMSFEIQALINGNYVKVAEGKSYNEKTGYTTTYTFDEVETTDIRIVITKMGGAIPNITELELFNKDNRVIPMFDGIEKTIVLDSCIDTENPIINDHICEENKPQVLVTIIIGISTTLIIATIIVISIVIRKKNKEV